MSAAGAVDHRMPGVSLKLRLVVLLGLLVVVFAVMAVALTRTVHDHDRIGRRIDDVLVPAGDDLDNLFVALVDQETGMRGFVITAEEQFLEPYKAGDLSERTHTARLRAGLGNEPDLLRDLDVIIAKVDTWRRTVAEPQITTARTDRGAAAAMVATGEGKRQFDGIRAVVATMQRDVDGRLADARADADAVQGRQTVTLALTLATTAAALLALSLLLFRWVLGPIDRLGRHVARVAGGELDHRVRGDGPSEIVVLGDRVEAMRVRVVTETATANESVAALARVNADLLRSNAELAEFAYVASHDLSEPLRVIGGFSQLLDADYRGRLDDTADDYLDHIVGGVTRMRTLLDGLLAVTRAGSEVLAVTEVDLGAVLAEVVRDLAAMTATTATTIVVGDLPRVAGDRSQLHQLFAHLVVNGLKYQAADRRPVVTVTQEEPPGCGADGADGYVTVVVADNGIGIDPRYHERVFGMFKRLHARDEFTGSGIGLALCRRIAERHGATIEIAPNEPEGTRFLVRFPTT